MEHAYEKLMKEHNLSLKELPSDAQIGIDAIQHIVKAVNLAEKTGKNVNPKVYDKIKANDKWVVREILDYVGDKNDNTDPLPNQADQVIKDDIQGATKVVDPAKKADDKATDPPEGTPAPNQGPQLTPEQVGKIDEELKALHDAGNSTISVHDVKAHAKTAYDVIFDTYEPEGQNGIETTYYSLIETQKEVFTLTKI